MTDRELMQQAYAVPLYEQLENVPLDARLVIEDSDGMGATILAIGRMCHAAATILREKLAQPYCDDCGGTDPECPLAQPEQEPRREWQGLTDDEKRLFSSWLDEKSDDAVFRAIEVKLREKNYD